MTPSDWNQVTAARLPAAHLAALAAVRDRADVRVFPGRKTVWVRWSPGRPEVVRCLLPAPGVEFFRHRDGHWFRFGSRVPTSDAPPDGDGQGLAGVLVPARLEPVPPGPRPSAPVRLRAVRGGGPKPVTALRCATADLRKWCETATTAELAVVRAARSGGRAVLLGKRLPAVPSGVRYWGDNLLLPVGFRPNPGLPSTTLRAAVGAAADELVFLDADGAEVVPRSAFEPLTRAGLRLAIREGR
jgi:hypothetical protein